MYFVTPAGITEKARMTRAYFSRNVDFYRETKNRILETFASLSLNWTPQAPDDEGTGVVRKRIAFYGADEVAEIGYVCLQDTDLTLVGVIDEQPRQRFFGFDVHDLQALEGQRANGIPFDRLIVMSFDRIDEVRPKLLDRGVPPDTAIWL